MGFAQIILDVRVCQGSCEAWHSGNLLTFHQCNLLLRRGLGARGMLPGTPLVLAKWPDARHPWNPIAGYLCKACRTRIHERAAGKSSACFIAASTSIMTASARCLV